MVSPKTKRKATKKGRSTPGRRNGRSASSSPTKKKQNKTTKPETKGGMDIDALAGANGAEAAAAAKDNEHVGGKPPDEVTADKEKKDKEDEDTPKDKDKEDEVAAKRNEDEKTTKDKDDEEPTKDEEDVGTTKGIEDEAVPPSSTVSPHAGDVQDPLAPPLLGQQSQDSYAHCASMDTDSDSDIDLSAIVDSSRKEKRDARKEQACRTAEAKAARQEKLVAAQRLAAQAEAEKKAKATQATATESQANKSGRSTPTSQLDAVAAAGAEANTPPRANSKSKSTKAAKSKKWNHSSYEQTYISAIIDVPQLARREKPEFVMQKGARLPWLSQRLCSSSLPLCLSTMLTFRRLPALLAKILQRWHLVFKIPLRTGVALPPTGMAIVSRYWSLSGWWIPHGGHKT